MMHQKHLLLDSEMMMKKCHIKMKKSRSPVPPPPTPLYNRGDGGGGVPD